MASTTQQMQVVDSRLETTVLLANEAPSGAIESPLFKDLGFPKLSATAPSDLFVHAAPTGTALGFLSMVQFIAVFMFSTLSGVVLQTTDMFANVVELKWPVNHIISPPSFGFSFTKAQKALVTANKEAFEKLNFIQTKYQNYELFRSDSVSDENFKSLMELSPPLNSSLPYDVGSLNGRSTWKMLNKIITGYLNVMVIGGAESKDGRGVWDKFVSLGVDTDKDTPTVKKQPRTLDTSTLGDMDNSLPLPGVDAYKQKKKNGLRGITMEDTLIFAKPTGKASQWSEFIGLAKAAPLRHGLLFPYFQGLGVPDKNFVPTVLSRHFRGCFGNSPAQSFENLQVFIRGWLSISTSESGIAMSHLVYGMMLSLNAGASLYIVKEEGLYLGFILLGYFEIRIGNRILSSKPQADWIQDISVFKGRRTAIDDLCIMLDSCRLHTTRTLSQVSSSMVQSTWAIVEEIAKRQNPDNVGKLAKILHVLGSGQTWWTITLPNIIRSIGYITGTTVYDATTPMYLNGMAGHIQDPFVRALMPFGPTAWSFNSTDANTGHKFKLDNPPTFTTFKEDGSGEFTGVAVFRKNILLAANDLRSVFERKLIEVNLGQKKGIRGSFATWSGPQGMQIWESICSETKRPTIEPEGIKKTVTGRKRDREEDDGQDAAKRAKLLKF